MSLIYTVIVIASAFVRQFVLPNPFECLGDYAVLINWAASAVIGTLSYIIVGKIYRRGSAPVIGSILYLLVFSAITGVLLLMSIFNFAWWWVLLMVIACAAVILGIRVLVFKCFGEGAV